MKAPFDHPAQQLVTEHLVIVRGAGASHRMIPEPLGRTAHLLGPPQPPAPNESRRIESPHHAASRMHAQYCTALDWYPICMTSVMPSVAPTPSRSQPPIRTDEHSVGIPLGVGLVGNGRKETSHLLVSKAATTEPVSRYVAPAIEVLHHCAVLALERHAPPARAAGSAVSSGVRRHASADGRRPGRADGHRRRAPRRLVLPSAWSLATEAELERVPQRWRELRPLPARQCPSGVGWPFAHVAALEAGCVCVECGVCHR